jgi:O-antigen/teichoic acid export membrane protein
VDRSGDNVLISGGVIFPGFTMYPLISCRRSMAKVGQEFQQLRCRLFHAIHRVGFKVAFFLGNFLVGRGVAFVGPLLLAATLPSEVYGRIEFSWSVSALIAMLIGAGAPLALPQLVLRQRPLSMLDILALSIAIPGALCLLGALGLLAFADVATALVLATITLCLAQATLSSYSRTFQYRNWAIWLDSLHIHGVVAVGILAVAFHRGTVGAIAAGLSLLASALVIASAFAFVRLRQQDLVSRIILVVSSGLPLLAYTLCVIWTVSSARIYIGATLSVHEVAIYSLCFRVASLLLVIHSVVGYAIFPRIYTSRTRKFDRFFSYYQIAMAVLSVAMMVGFRFALDLAGPSLKLHFLPDAVPYFSIVMLQVFAWNVSAILEMRISRARRAASAAVGTLVVGVVVAAIVAALFWTGTLTLWLVATVCAVQTIGVVAVQLFVLWKRGLKMPRTCLTLLVATIGLMVVAWVAS